jgi:hypothetical protein
MPLIMKTRQESQSRGISFVFYIVDHQDISTPHYPISSNIPEECSYQDENQILEHFENNRSKSPEIFCLWQGSDVRMNCLSFV